MEWLRAYDDLLLEPDKGVYIAALSLESVSESISGAGLLPVTSMQSYSVSRQNKNG